MNDPKEHQWDDPFVNYKYPVGENRCLRCGLLHPLEDPDLLVECFNCDGSGEVIYEDFGMCRCPTCGGVGVTVDPLYRLPECKDVA